ncbi:hypothetical protein BYT27DRAFT_7220582 [Phlegmacium glaucopus]|nr:hypothetical protein BYT27DRAFT_7220582 [Phlegmacium glaucopus]
MQSLLSQSESNAFQSFLSSIDYTEDTIPVEEWAAFSASSSADPSYSDEDILVDSVQNPEERRALAKATKDLMSLGAADGNWDDPNDTAQAIRQYDQQCQQESHGVNSYPSRHDSFPFLRTKSQPLQPIQSPMQLQHHPASPLPTGSPGLQQRSPRSSYSFSQQQQLQQLHMPQQPHQRGRVRDTSPGTKRSHTLPSASPSFDRPSSDLHKRRRLSPGKSSTLATTSAGFSRSGHSSSNPQSGPQQQQSSKPHLLSPSQKKANHIQSEQKRRANIRRGYAALCETVPALREAIREEEEAERITAGTTAVVSGVGIGDGFRMNGAGRKKKNKKGNEKDPDDQDKDKTDGRAGPRSENMVLSKTIEHIQYLLTDRSSLLARLQHARASLPPGHPALTALSPDPPWEREWNGGEGKLTLGDGDGDEEGDGGSGDDEEDD